MEVKFGTSGFEKNRDDLLQEMRYNIDWLSTRTTKTMVRILLMNSLGPPSGGREWDQERGVDARASIAAGKSLECNSRPFWEESAGFARMIEMRKSQVGSMMVCYPALGILSCQSL